MKTTATSNMSDTPTALTLDDVLKAKEKIDTLKPHISDFAGIPIIENPFLAEGEIRIMVGPNTIRGLKETEEKLTWQTEI